METQQTWFGLKKDKPDFEIQCDEDRDLFFGRKSESKQVTTILQRSFRSTRKPPKFILYGDWGAGKTHTLRHYEHLITKDESKRAKLIFKELPDIQSKDKFSVLHSALLDAIGQDTVQGWMRSLSQEHGLDTEEIIRERTQSSDVAKAFISQTITGEASAIGWEWLRAETPLSPSRANLIMLSSKGLSQSQEFVHVLRELGRLCAQATKETLVFLVDELGNLNETANKDSENDWKWAFRGIFGQENKEFGFIGAGTWMGEDDCPRALQDQQVVTRLGLENIIQLGPFGQEEAVDFLKSLCRAFVDAKKAEKLKKKYAEEANEEPIDAESFPFTTDGMDLLAGHACREGGTTYPRDLLGLVDDFCNRAMDKKRHILSHEFIDSEISFSD
jgi:Cdc6-like AAA superfamily ATPase